LADKVALVVAVAVAVAAVAVAVVAIAGVVAVVMTIGSLRPKFNGTTVALADLVVVIEYFLDASVLTAIKSC